MTFVCAIDLPLGTRFYYHRFGSKVMLEVVENPDGLRNCCKCGFALNRSLCNSFNCLGKTRVDSTNVMVKRLKND